MQGFHLGKDGARLCVYTGQMCRQWGRGHGHELGMCLFHGRWLREQAAKGGQG